MPDEVEIRPFHMDDTEALWRLFRQPGVLATTMTLPSERVDQRRKRYEELGPDDHAFVAIRHGEVAGSAGLHVGAGRRRHAASLGIAVSPTHQRVGVGDLLMLALLDLADRWLGLRRVELGVLVGNHAARRLYEKHGFVEEGILRQSVASDGELRDELCMARLRPAMPAASADRAGAEPAADRAGLEPRGAEPAADRADPGAQAGMGSSASSP